MNVRKQAEHLYCGAVGALLPLPPRRILPFLAAVLRRCSRWLISCCSCSWNPRAYANRKKQARLALLEGSGGSTGGGGSSSGHGSRSRPRARSRASPPRIDGDGPSSQTTHRRGSAETLTGLLPENLNTRAQKRARSKTPSPPPTPPSAAAHGEQGNDAAADPFFEDEPFELPSSAEEDAIDDLMFVSYDATLKNAQGDDASSDFSPGDGARNGGARDAQEIATKERPLPPSPNGSGVKRKTPLVVQGPIATPPTTANSKSSSGTNSSDDSGGTENNLSFASLPARATQEHVSRGETILLIN